MSTPNAARYLPSSSSPELRAQQRLELELSGLEDLDRFDQAFAQLPDDHRQVITLSKLFGYAHADIASEMGRREGAVRVLLHRALARLAWVLNDTEGHEL